MAGFFTWHLAFQRRQAHTQSRRHVGSVRGKVSHLRWRLPMTKLLAFAGVVLLWVVPTAAHHSFAAEFDENKPVTLKGKLTQLDWLNLLPCPQLFRTDPHGQPGRAA